MNNLSQKKPIDVISESSVAWLSKIMSPEKLRLPFSNTSCSHLKSLSNEFNQNLIYFTTKCPVNIFVEKQIDKVKEYLVYTDFSLIEIAILTGFTSTFSMARTLLTACNLPLSYFKNIRVEKQRLINETLPERL